MAGTSDLGLVSLVFKWEVRNGANLGYLETKSQFFMEILALNVVEEAFCLRQMRNEHSLLMVGNKSTSLSEDLGGSPCRSSLKLVTQDSRARRPLVSLGVPCGVSQELSSISDK